MPIDLNADVGERFGAWTLGDEDALFGSVTSVSVACGFHAGDPDVMRQTLVLARSAGVSVGAHPGFPDLQGFGRRETHLASSEVENLVLYQVGALAALARAEGLTLAHVKPHGALYNQCGRDQALADAVARAVRAAGPSLVLVALSGSALAGAGARAGLRVAAEAFADRGYRADGSLAPRGMPGAVITDPAVAAARAVGLARDGVVEALDGTTLHLRADTLCVHGDTPGAVAIARAVRSALEAAGIPVVALSR